MGACRSYYSSTYSCLTKSYICTAVKKFTYSLQLLLYSAQKIVTWALETLVLLGFKRLPRFDWAAYEA